MKETENGDNRNDLHNLHDPIRTLSDWYIESKNEDVMYIIKLAIKGLHKLNCFHSHIILIYPDKGCCLYNSPL